MKIHYYFYIILTFISCKQDVKKLKSTENNIEKSEKLSKTEQKSETEKVEFIQHKTFGIIIDQNNRLYDAKLKEIGSIYSRGMEKVEIIEISKKMYNQENISDYCKKANFVKIRYNNKECIIFGKEIFEINNEQKFTFQNQKGNNFSVFPVTNFEMGASDENGLTDCDDYSVLIIHNEKEQKFNSINYNSNEKVKLLHDDGSDEKIYKFSIEKDTLIIGIKALHQEGGSIYDLKTTFKSNFSKSIIADKKIFEENELEKLNQIK